MQNKAAFLISPKSPLQIQDAPLGHPSPDELLIRNHAIAINPVDHKQVDTGALVREWPCILGNDIAGTVVEVGSGIASTKFKVSDRVAALAPHISTGNPRHAGFQLYTIAKAAVASHIPNTMAFTDAAVLPLATLTASSALFSPEYLGLDAPLSSKPKSAENENKVVLVWGGSSSVGSSAIQLCAAAGYSVFATASAKNFGLVRDLGATQVFDYHEPQVVNEMIDAARGKLVVGAYDAITSEQSLVACGAFLHGTGGGRLSCTITSMKFPDMPEGVSIQAGRPPLQAPDGGVPIWRQVWIAMMNEGIQDGKYRAKPDAFVIKGGLDRLQEGVDMVRKGVSARKVVVELL